MTITAQAGRNRALSGIANHADAIALEGEVEGHLNMKMLDTLRDLASGRTIWPPIDSELVDLKERGLLRGTVLNAGCGTRKIDHLIDGELFNQDIKWPGDTRTYVHVFSPIHDIPKPDDTFDCVLCIAVLEHVINPVEVVRELFRVTKPGGYTVASVPFMQPEHKIPTDYQRYTRDGLETLFSNAGFSVREIKPLFTVFHTLHWITSEWLHMRNSFFYRMLRVLLLIPLALLAKRSALVSEKIASGFRIVARKPAYLGPP